GGCRAAAVAHQGRAVCRRAERSVVALGEFDTMPPLPRQYLNRLSDVLFILSRHLNVAAGVPDVLWQPRRVAGSSPHLPINGLRAVFSCGRSGAWLVQALAGRLLA
ncbi:MAG: ATP:cob(I)alamin adenosyltransferase, partial [Vogesella sp.]|uniref:ATP:cob(I)alamin adenosyltransferase n=1 Tax=Vogesella sp. TaxID=1904252 RepID=UPI003F3AC0E6